MGNQGGSNQGVIRLKQWVQDQEIGRIEKVQVWTNQPVWPQGIQMPLANENEKPEKLDWDLWLAPQPKDPLPRDYILLIGGVFGNMEQVHWEIWAAICLMHLIKPYS